MFGKLKWMANQNNGFGALSFTRVLRNYILGKYRDIMSCKQTAMLAVLQRLPRQYYEYHSTYAPINIMNYKFFSSYCEYYDDFQTYSCVQKST